MAVDGMHSVSHRSNEDEFVLVDLVFLAVLYMRMMSLYEIGGVVDEFSVEEVAVVVVVVVVVLPTSLPT